MASTSRVVHLTKRMPFIVAAVGTFPSAAALRTSLESRTNGQRISVDPCTRRLIESNGGKPGEEGRFWLSPQPSFISLYRATNGELGEATGQDYSKGCTVHQSMVALEEVGAVKLPPDAGPACRLEYINQPVWDRDIIYHDPISGMVFCVSRDPNGLCLSTYRLNPQDHFGSEKAWIYGREPICDIQPG